MSGAAGIDHVIIATRDLDAARDRYRRLGFQVTPRGHHSHLGSSNHCIMLAGRDYLELLDPGGRRPFFAAFLDRRAGAGGAAGIAGRSADAEATRAAWQAAGLDPAPVVAFGRPVELPEGPPREARFRTTDTKMGRTPELRLFACQQLTPELVWQERWLDHANGAQAIAEIVVMAQDPAARAALYAPVFGTVPQPVEGGVAVPTGGAPLTVLTPAAAAARYPGDPLLAAAPPLVMAIVVAVGDRAATARYLGGSLVVGSRDAAGVIVEFR